MIPAIESLKTRDDWPSRVGRFRVARAFFDRMDIDGASSMFSGLVILAAERDMWLDETSYLAASRSFRPTIPGEIIPEYRAEFDAGSARPRWVEIVS